MHSNFQGLHGMPTNSGFAPPPLSLLTLLPPCEDELYNVGQVPRPPFLRTARSSDAPLQKLSHSASTIFSSSTISMQESRVSGRYTLKRRSSDPRRHSPSGSPQIESSKHEAAPAKLRSVISSRFIRRGRAAERDGKTTQGPASSQQTGSCKSKQPSISSRLSDSNTDLSIILCQSRYEKYVHHGADELWFGSVDPINTFMDILRHLEADEDAAICYKGESHSASSTTTETLSSNASIPRRSKLKLWLRPDKDGSTTDSHARRGNATVSENTLDPASPSSIWPIDETFAIPNESRQSRQRATVPARRTSTSELEWGAAAKQLWGNEHGHRHRKQGLPDAARGAPADYNNVWLSWALSTPQNQDMALAARDTDLVPRRTSLARDAENILATDTPQLRSWTAFENAYMNSLLDLSEMPVKPIGVPPYPCCPDATPLDIGHLAAPQPPWEILRLRTMYRMDVFSLPSEVCALIVGLLEDCAETIGVQLVMLHFLDRTALYRLTPDGVQYDNRSRAASVAGHMILNRNNGLVVSDLQQDWRFKGQETYERFYRLYNGMPVLAANGLPIGAISAVDLTPREGFDVTHELRQLSVFIGSVLEAHFRRQWSQRVCIMAQHLHQLRHLLLLEHDFGDTFEMLAQGSTSETAPYRQAQEVAAGLYDPRGVAQMGLHMTAVDVRSLESVLSTVASDTQLEIACLLLLRLDGAQADASILCLHQRHDDKSTDLYPDGTHFTKSRPFLCTLFEERRGSKSKRRMSLLHESSSEDYILRQNTCPVPHKTCEQPANHHRTNITEPDAGPWIEMSEEEIRVQRTEACMLHPIKCHPSRVRFRASLTVQIAKRGHLGLALSILTRRPDRIIGIEDLRYIEALRPFLASAFYRFGLDDASAIDKSEHVRRGTLLRGSPVDVSALHLHRTTSTRTLNSSRLHLRTRSNATHGCDMQTSPTQSASPVSPVAKSNPLATMSTASTSSLHSKASHVLRQPSYDAFGSSRDGRTARSPRTDSSPSSPISNDLTPSRRTPPRSLPPVPRAKRAAIVRDSTSVERMTCKRLDGPNGTDGDGQECCFVRSQRVPSVPARSQDRRARSPDVVPQLHPSRPTHSRDSSFLSLARAASSRNLRAQDSDDEVNLRDGLRSPSTPLASSRTGTTGTTRPDSCLTIQARSSSESFRS